MTADVTGTSCLRAGKEVFSANSGYCLLGCEKPRWFSSLKDRGSFTVRLCHKQYYNFIDLYINRRSDSP